MKPEAFASRIRVGRSIAFGVLAAALIIAAGRAAAQVNTPGVIFVETPSSPVLGRLGVVYTLTDNESDPHDAQVRYSVDGGDNFLPASAAAGGGGLDVLAASPEGVRHVFVWDVLKDLGERRELDVRIRVSAIGRGLNSVPVETAPFFVDTTVSLARLTGTVFAGDSGAPLAGATVELRVGGALADTGVTGADGRFDAGTASLAGPVELSVACASGCTGYDALTLQNLQAPLELPVFLTPAVPRPPLGLIAFAGADEAQLRWRPGTEGDLAGYHVYRSFDGSPFERITEEPVPNTVFEDIEVGIQTLSNPEEPPVVQYQITAIDTAGNESPASATVIANTSEFVVTLPEVDAGPGNIARVPIRVANASGINVAAFDIKLRTTPGAFVGAEVRRTGMTEAVGFFQNDNFLASEGRLLISGIGSAEVLRGEGNIFDVFFELPVDAPAGSTIPIEIEEVKFYNQNVTRLSVDFSGTGAVNVTLDCLEGDLNNDGVVTEADARLALDISVRLFQPDPCQNQASDLNGDGRIDSADATLILRLANNLPLNPGEGKVHRPKVDKGTVLNVQLGSIAETEPGDVVDIPLTIADATGISAFDVTIGFDSQRPNLVLLDVLPGSLTADFEFEDRKTAGGVAISASRATEIESGTGTLAVLRFRVAESVAYDAEFPVRINAIELKRQFGESFQWFAETETVNGLISTKSVFAGNVVTVSVLDGSQAVSGAVVTTTTNYKGTEGAEGVFTFLDLPAGLTTFQACAPGYAPASVSPFLSGGNENVEIDLSPSAGSACGPPPVESALLRFAIVDKNKDGRLSRQEFDLVVPGLSDISFGAADTNNDDFLSVPELFQASQGANVHVGDSNGDGVMDLSEILRIVQLYNTAKYSCAPPSEITEDGYRPDPLGNFVCWPHSADAMEQDWIISLSELLRILQFFRLEAYEWCPERSIEDGYCLGENCCTAN